MTPSVNETVVIAERPLDASSESVLTPTAVLFLADLVRRFRPSVDELRADAAGVLRAVPAPDTSPRPARWQCAPPPPELAGPRVDLVGAVDVQTILAMRSSGATAFIADLEDATAPRWRDVLGAHSLLRSMIARARRLGPHAAPRLVPILMRPRALDRDEEHLFVDERCVPAALFDFGLYCFHNAHALAAMGAGPFLAITRLHDVAEASFWERVCAWVEDHLGLAPFTIGVSVRIDTVRALTELDDILWVLRRRAIGVACGRAAYLRDLIAHGAEDVTPDRRFLTVDRPPLASVSARIIRACRERGVQALGPLVNVSPPSVKESAARSVYAQVYASAARHARVGFDGTRVADASYVGVARAALAATAGQARSAWSSASRDRPRTPLPDEASVRENIRIALVHLEASLEGRARVHRGHFVEDRATARAARAQLWEWLQRHIEIDGEHVLDRARFLALARDEARRLESSPRARFALERICLAEHIAALDEQEAILERDLLVYASRA